MEKRYSCREAWQKNIHAYAIITVGFSYLYASFMLFPFLSAYVNNHFIAAIFFMIGSLSYLSAFLTAGDCSSNE